MSHVGRKSGRGSEAAIVNCRAYLWAAQHERERYIESLPAVTWKGLALRTLRCHGTSGEGPHDVNVPEALAWSLMHPEGFCCVYHAGDHR